MADEGTADTFEYTLAGREMVFKKVNRSQLLMLQRMVRKIQGDMEAVRDDPARVGELLARLNDMAFEAAESRFTSDEDLMYVQTEVLRGNVESEDIFAILSNGNKRIAEPDDDADPAPAKRAGRKAPAKKAAKKVPVQRRGAR